VRPQKEIIFFEKRSWHEKPPDLFVSQETIKNGQPEAMDYCSICYDVWDGSSRSSPSANYVACSIILVYITFLI
jgi:hypothetical protein